MSFAIEKKVKAVAKAKGTKISWVPLSAENTAEIKRIMAETNQTLVYVGNHLLSQAIAAYNAEVEAKAKSKK